MKIHEYQAKAILKKYGVAVPRGAMAASQDEAEAVAKELLSSGASGVVVKAQIHAGGRGKGGGVKIAKSVNEAGELASKMLGMKLITHQTGPEGRIVRRRSSKRPCPSRRNSILEFWLTAPRASPYSWPRPRAAWRSSRSPPRIRTRFSSSTSIPAWAWRRFKLERSPSNSDWVRSRSIPR